MIHLALSIKGKSTLIFSPTCSSHLSASIKTTLISEWISPLKETFKDCNYTSRTWHKLKIWHLHKVVNFRNDKPSNTWDILKEHSYHVLSINYQNWELKYTTLQSALEVFTQLLQKLLKCNSEFNEYILPSNHLTTGSRQTTIDKSLVSARTYEPGVFWTLNLSIVRQVDEPLSHILYFD